MKFKIDENLPGELVAGLRDLGHEAHTVFDEGLVGARDAVLISVVASENRILLTLDKGIANLQHYPAARRSGVVLFRPARSGQRSVVAFIRKRPPEILELDLHGRLTVVGPNRIRVR